MKKHRISLLIAAACSFVSSLSLILTPFYLGLAIDFMIGVDHVDFDGVSRNLSLALLMYGLNFVFCHNNLLHLMNRRELCLHFQWKRPRFSIHIFSISL